MSAAAVTAGVLVIWLWLAPPDLYPRFLIWLAAPAALAVAAAGRRVPLALPLIAAALFLMVRLDAAHWSQDPLPDRQAAVLVRAIQSRGGNPCVLPLIRGSLLAYAHAPREVTRPTQLRNCELVLSLAVDPQSLRLAARRGFEHHWLLKAWTPMTVFSRLPQDELLGETSRGIVPTARSRPVRFPKSAAGARPGRSLSQFQQKATRGSCSLQGTPNAQLTATVDRVPIPFDSLVTAA
jgi:hypothetical protein